ncbi:hydrogenase formation protein HypD [Candidatus Thiothrix sp. Deng01]|uniref:Hydrogenase maturation factor n=1 Tax=Candidatus Thiothrix phosphatis TaxID=3112415 RepID=A0ABU6CTW7_9GAMM|nr:hydrogenase formation protein HypD [Candidatus Thiothrix sp. Deng01]MEB4590259.1 hydrogenase formation protein HypD [Candidatus Thiothrix sp. Deng01]
MKYIDEFRDPVKAKKLVDEIHKLATSAALVERSQSQPLQIMEFCGGHTHTLFKYGIESMLPDTIEMVHGPGCPVCVLPMARVDDCVAIAEQPGVIFTTFGDAMRVPGTRKSLLQAKADGCDVRMVYSPMDALALARKHPDREVVFFALGFETTMPSTALTLLQAQREGLKNFSLFCNHITTPATMRAILTDPDLRLDGFLAPGHVSMVIGVQPYAFVAHDYHKPLVITGFEPLDILQAMWMLVKQLAEGRCDVENQYARIVPEAGNTAGLHAIHAVYETREHSEFRGLGNIGDAGVQIRAAYAGFDAEKKFNVQAASSSHDPAHLKCADVLRGVMKPWECPAFGTSCNPQTPLGALMVSPEGSCAAYYAYGKLAKRSA